MSQEQKNEKPYLGIDFDKLEAYCGDLKWKLKPNGHIKSNTDIIKKSIKKYEDILQKVQQGKEFESKRIEIYEQATKEILEASLEKFDYEKAANDPQAGPALLGNLSNECKDFFLILGGPTGAKLLQMRLKSMTSDT